MKIIDWILNIFKKNDDIVEGYRVVETSTGYIVKLFQFFLGEDIEIDTLEFKNKTEMKEYLTLTFGERYV